MNCCSCNDPRNANYHTFVIYGRYPYRDQFDYQSTETSYVDWYTCNIHQPFESDLQDMYDSGRTEWEPIWFHQTHLRGDL